MCEWQFIGSKQHSAVEQHGKIFFTCTSHTYRKKKLKTCSHQNEMKMKENIVILYLLCIQINLVRRVFFVFLHSTLYPKILHHLGENCISYDENNFF